MAPTDDSSKLKTNPAIPRAKKPATSALRKAVPREPESDEAGVRYSIVEPRKKQRSTER